MGTQIGDACVDVAIESSEEDVQETTLPVVGPSRPKRKGKAEILRYFTEISAGVWACLLCRDQREDPLRNRLKRRKDGSRNIFWRHMECTHSKLYNEMKGIKPDQHTMSQAYRQGGTVKKTLEKTKEIIAHFARLTDSPWAIVDNVGFKIMWKYAVEITVDPPGSKAIKDAMHKLYVNMKAKLMSALADVPSVSLTVDAWTAENSCGLLGITVHWVNDQWELCKRVLVIRELVGKHSGENMGAIVLQALDDVGLKTKVSAITTDNASSNGRMVGMLAKELKPINNRFTRDRHVPCAAHVLNIIIHAALQSLRVSTTWTLEAMESHAEMVSHDGGLLLGDAIAGVRQVVTSIRASTQRRQQYVKTCNDMGKNSNQLSLDCPTRWNNTHDILHAALENREVDLMALQIMSMTNKDIRIAREEWDMLADFRDILGPFYRTTKYVNGSKTVRVVEVIRIMKALLHHVDTILSKFDMATIFSSARRMTTRQIASIRRACESMNQR
ncbi:putative transcriptional regulator tpeD [Wolffia australiana]